MMYAELQEEPMLIIQYLGAVAILIRLHMAGNYWWFLFARISAHRLNPSHR